MTDDADSPRAPRGRRPAPRTPLARRTRRARRPGACGQCAFRASRQRSSGSATSMITAGSQRGKCSLPSTVHRRTWPAMIGSVGAPQREQNPATACQFASATAWVSRPASRSLSRCPASRRPALARPGASSLARCPARLDVRERPADAEVGDVIGVDAEQEPDAVRRLRPGSTKISSADPSSSLASAWPSSMTSTLVPGSSQAFASQASSVRSCADRSTSCRVSAIAARNRNQGARHRPRIRRDPPRRRSPPGARPWRRDQLRPVSRSAASSSHR